MLGKTSHAPSLTLRHYLEFCTGTSRKKQLEERGVHEIGVSSLRFSCKAGEHASQMKDDLNVEHHTWWVVSTLSAGT